MQNPYGAVPEALKDTRLTLRDIMADMLNTKKMEGELSLAKSKAETETALVSQGIERDRLRNTMDITRLEQTDRQHQQQGELAQKQFGLAQAAQTHLHGPAFAEQKRLHDAQINKLNADRTALSQETQKNDEVVPVRQFLEENNAMAYADVLNITNLDERQKRSHFAGIGNEIKKMEAASPLFKTTRAMADTKREITKLAGDFHAAQDKETKKTIQDKMEQLEARRLSLNMFQSGANSPKEKDLLELSGKLWKSMDEETKIGLYNNDYNKYHNDYAAGINKMQKAVAEDEKLYKRLIISPTYNEDIKAAMAAIDALPATHPDKARIGLHAQKLKAAGDEAGLYKYLNAKSWADYARSQPQ